MRVLIAGGRGFLGGALEQELEARGHEVWLLTRGARTRSNEFRWDGSSAEAWTAIINSVDAVVNACGHGLEHWPWTAAQKRRFIASRVEPGRILATAICEATRPPRVFVQYSGINRYGLSGREVAEETTGAAEDFLAQLTVHWEAASQPVEAVGVRHVIVRNAIVLDGSRGLFPLMSLGCKLFLGGSLGKGTQPVPWIHVIDQVRAVLHLLEDKRATGPYNLVAPALTSHTELMQATCSALGRPYWLHVPAWLLRLVLGEMSVLVLEGRYARPKRLLEAGFEFKFPEIGLALHELFHRGASPRHPRP